MTDALAGGAPAPAEAASVPIDTSTAAPNPVEKSVPVAEKPQADTPEPRRQLDDIIKDASKKVAEKAEAKAKEPEPKADKAEKPVAKEDAKPEAKAKEPEPAKPAAERGEDGKFVSKDPAKAQEAPKPVEQTKPDAPHREAPSRFSADAKAAWEAAPEAVKAEAHRAIRELEQGHQKYKADAEAYSEIKSYDEFARKNGSSVMKAMEQYMALDRGLRSQDPQIKQAAIAHVMQHAGVDPRAWAAKIMGQTPDQVQSEQHQTIHALRQELAQIKQQVGTVTQTFQQQQVDTVTEKVQSFAAEHPRFDELADDIRFFLTSDKVDQSLPPQERLSKAYEFAERLNPAPAAYQPAPLTQVATPPAPNPAGSKSIAGAPANGSDPSIPAKRNGQRTSIDDALKRAHARLAS